MTPAQAFAYEKLARRRINRNRAIALRIAFLGARGKTDAVNDQMKEWQQP
jgi:hypothetical protein